MVAAGCLEKQENIEMNITTDTEKLSDDYVAKYLSLLEESVDLDFLSMYLLHLTLLNNNG